jgi:hypothetical protein
MAAHYELLVNQVVTALRRGQRLTRPLQNRIFEFSKELLDSGEAVLARVLLRVLRKIEPYEARFQWLLGVCEFHLGNLALARRNLEHHWLQTRRPQTAFLLARVCHVSGDRAQMSDYLRAVPPYERYLVGNAPLFQLLAGESQAIGDGNRQLGDFGPFFNADEQGAVSRLLAKLYWRRGLSRLEASEAKGAIEDFEACERFLKGGNHG